MLLCPLVFKANCYNPVSCFYHCKVTSPLPSMQLETRHAPLKMVQGTVKETLLTIKPFSDKLDDSLIHVFYYKDIRQVHL